MDPTEPDWSVPLVFQHQASATYSSTFSQYYISLQYQSAYTLQKLYFPQLHFLASNQQIEIEARRVGRFQGLQVKSAHSPQSKHTAFKSPDSEWKSLAHHLSSSTTKNRMILKLIKKKLLPSPSASLSLSLPPLLSLLLPLSPLFTSVCVLHTEPIHWTYLFAAVHESCCLPLLNGSLPQLLAKLRDIASL